MAYITASERDLLVKARLRLGLTQKALANLAAMSTRTVSRAETTGEISSSHYSHLMHTLTGEKTIPKPASSEHSPLVVTCAELLKHAIANNDMSIVRLVVNILEQIKPT